MPRSAILNVMVQAAMKAGRSLARDFGEVQNLQVSLKGPGDFVSQADHRAEAIVHAELSKARPDYAFLMEERGEIAGADGQHRFLVDPLDGTTNFLHGIPIFAVSIGLERQGQLIAGVIYNPAMDELYTAERGGGAFLNDRRMRVAARRKLSDSVIGTGIPHLGRGEHGRSLIELRHVMAEAAGIRRLGAASLDLAYVAAPRRRMPAASAITCRSSISERPCSPRPRCGMPVPITLSLSLRRAATRMRRSLRKAPPPRSAV